MKFTLSPNPTFKTDVTLSVPEGSGTTKVAFEFKYKNNKEFNEWMEENQGKLASVVLVDVIVSWGVQDDKGGIAEITVDTVAELLINYPSAGQEIYGAYSHALRDSHIKN